MLTARLIRFGRERKSLEVKSCPSAVGANGCPPDSNHLTSRLRVIALRPVSLLNPKWQQVELSSNGRREEMTDVTLRSNAIFHGRYFATESLYFAKLPAGKYEVTGFGSAGPGPGLILALIGSDSAKAQALPSFTIEAGRLANLGTLVFAPEMGKELPEQLALLRGPMGRKNALDALLAESARDALPLPAGGGRAKPPRWTNSGCLRRPASGCLGFICGWGTRGSRVGRTSGSCCSAQAPTPGCAMRPTPWGRFSPSRSLQIA